MGPSATEGGVPGQLMACGGQAWLLASLPLRDGTPTWHPAAFLTPRISPAGHSATPLLSFRLSSEG